MGRWPLLHVVFGDRWQPDSALGKWCGDPGSRVVEIITYPSVALNPPWGRVAQPAALLVSSG